MAFTFNAHLNWEAEGNPDPVAQPEYFIWAEDIVTIERFIEDNFGVDENGTEELDGGGIVKKSIVKSIKVRGNQVLGSQQYDILSLDVEEENLIAINAKINSILARMRTHGLIQLGG